MERSHRQRLLETMRGTRLWKSGEAALGSWYTDAEIEAAVAAIRSSMDWTVGFQAHDEVACFEAAFAAYVGVEHAIAVNGAGTGLDMAVMSLDLQPGDEVISCAINFPGTHLAIIGQGGKLILCEPDPHTLNIDPVDLARRITPRTRAVLVTHMNGLSADMDALQQVCDQHPHPVYGPPKLIGDAARACGADYKGRKVGKDGWLTVFSFQSKKLMTTLGEGGMITTDDPEVAERLRDYRSFGRGRGWGTNYKLTKVQAAVGSVQLARLDAMNAARVRHADERTRHLQGLAGLTLPPAPEGYRHIHYVYTILLDDAFAGAGRNRLIATLREEYGVGCSIANPPTYAKNHLIDEHVRGQRCPQADAIGSRVFCPILHPLMSEDENAYVAAAIEDAVERLAGL